VNDHVDTDCKRPGPKPCLGTECEKEICNSVTELQKVGHSLSHKEVLQLDGETDSKRVTQVLKIPCHQNCSVKASRCDITLLSDSRKVCLLPKALWQQKKPGKNSLINEAF